MMIIVYFFIGFVALGFICGIMDVFTNSVNDKTPSMKGDYQKGLYVRDSYNNVNGYNDKVEYYHDVRKTSDYTANYSDSCNSGNNNFGRQIHCINNSCYKSKDNESTSLFSKEELNFLNSINIDDKF